MKANEAKRKIFTDAVDLIGGGESEVSGANCVEMLGIRERCYPERIFISDCL